MKAAEMMGAFAHPEYLKEAMTHRSSATKNWNSSERLEFLGDRVLGLLMSEWLIKVYPHEDESTIGARFAHLVSREVLAAIADKIGLGEMLIISSSDLKLGVSRRAKVLADALEAAIGAVYRDRGLEAARKFMQLAWQGRVMRDVAPPKDAKTALQEWAQANGVSARYVVTAQRGPAHAPTFVVTVEAGRLSASAESSQGKRAAEQLAAERLLKTIT